MDFPPDWISKNENDKKLLDAAEVNKAVPTEGRRLAIAGVSIFYQKANSIKRIPLPDDIIFFDGLD